MIEALLRGLAASSADDEDALVDELRRLHHLGEARGDGSGDSLEGLRLRLAAYERELRQDRALRAEGLRRLDALLARPSTGGQDLPTGAVSDADPTDRDELIELLGALRELVLAHPVAARGLSAALMAEGRRYASTPRGAALAGRLRRSVSVQRAHLAWDQLTLGLLEGAEHEGPLPGELIDALFEASSAAEREQLLVSATTPRRR